MGYLIISGILFIVSIITNFIRSDIHQFSLGRIRGNDGFYKCKQWQSRSISSNTLLISVILLVTCSPLSALATFGIGISMILIQKVIIWMIDLAIENKDK
jgi:hypothetical protein